MIFITLGSQRFQFNRLLKAVDDLIEQGVITDEVYAQTGFSDYVPRHYAYGAFLDHERFQQLQGDADVVITHGGTGAIVGALKQGKKVIAVPRLARYGEHVDNHQIQLLRVFEGMGYIVACYDIDQLGDACRLIDKITLKSYESNRNGLLNSIDDYLEVLETGSEL